MIKIHILQGLLISTIILYVTPLLANPETSSDTQQIYTADTQETEQEFFFDDIYFDEEDNYDFMNEYLDTTALDHINKTIDPAEAMSILNLINAPAILQVPFFLHTNPINKRSLLDQPIFEPDRAVFPYSTVCGLTAFMRKTNRSNFTKDSTNLRSYLSLKEDQLISRLQESIANLVKLLPQYEIDIEKIFNLFENMTIEERQAGCMFHFTKKWNHATLRVLLPFFYQESNFSLTKREQDAIANEFGVMDPEEEKQFRKAHFISDRIGMGDTRIEIDQRIINRPSVTIRCGAQATIPTAWTWGSGFMGSSFPQPSILPTFDLDPLFDAFTDPSPAVEQAAFDSVSNFLFDSFDRIAANLIDIKLGNNRHLGIGAYMRTKTPLRAYMNNSFADYISLTNRISIELFLPSIEKRFYINTIDSKAFNDRNFKDLTQAASNLAFLEEQFIERIFLRAFPTRVQPGAIIRWTNAAYYKGKRYGFSIGTDFWMQTRDSLGKIYTSSSVRQQLNREKAQPPFATQTKIFGSITRKHVTPLTSYFFSIIGDTILTNKGLGQDYSIALNFEASF